MEGDAVTSERDPTCGSVAEIGAVRRCQGKENLILFPLKSEGARDRKAGAVSGAAGRSAEVLRARGGVGVEIGTASRVWQSHIYIRMFAVWAKQRVYRAGFIMNLRSK